MLTYVISPLPSGVLPTYDPEALADELVAACGSSYGLSSAGTTLTLFPGADCNAQQVLQVIEHHLSTDAAATLRFARHLTASGWRGWISSTARPMRMARLRLVGNW